jgi:hypothetical protein
VYKYYKLRPLLHLLSLRKLIFSLVVLFSGYFSAFSQTASIKGNVFDAVTKDGLVGALITIDSIPQPQMADDKGNFEFSGLSAGDYELHFTLLGYITGEKHITVKAGETVKLFTGLKQDSKELGEVTVFGKSDREQESGSRNREMNAGNITNVISLMAMVRSPDINASNVLQRMSGITLEHSSGGDEAYAIIRGMEPRYSNTLVNGIKIASPDNKNRFVQLNIIPSDILSSIEISKSLLPDMEGDAIGGTVNMVVKDAPTVTSFKATGSIGYSQLFFDEKYIDFNKSDIQKLSPVQRNSPTYETQSSDFSKSNLDFHPRQSPPSGTLGFSFTKRLMHDKIGVVIADNVQNQYYGNISSRYTVSPGGSNSDSLEATTVSNYKGYTQQLNNGLAAHVDYVINEKNKINVDNFYIYSYLAQSRLSMDTTLIGTGRVGPGTGQIFLNDESTTQHQYIDNLKVSGKHSLTSNLALDWGGVLSDAGRRLPDLANIETDLRILPDFTPTATFFDHVTHSWQKNTDKSYTGILNLDHDKKWDGKDLELKAGGLYRNQLRNNNQDDYTLQSIADPKTGIKPVWTNIYNARDTAFNSTGTGQFNPNNYHVDETVFAEYLMARLKLEQWELGGGLRVENTITNWNINTISATQLTSGTQTYQDFLPSAFLKYKLLSDKQYLHFSYFRSISRPNYYELVPGGTRSTENITRGNPYLQHSVADNYDVRYELFPKGEQNIFLGAFYKQITDPIETRLEIGTGFPVQSLINAGTAQNYGTELAFTKYWGDIGVTGNYTYTHSRVNSAKLSYQGATVYETRPLQGQTDHIANVSLLYKNVKKGIFAQLSYQYQGKTLALTSVYYQSDYYQKPMNILAFSAEKDLHKHFTIFGKFNNLLNTPSKQYVQNRILASQDIYKATYSIGIRYSH